MGSVGVAGRIAAIGAVVVAIVVIAVLLFTGGDNPYTLKAKFINASQLVKGNNVQIGGTRAGTVDSIALDKDGQAVVTMTVNDEFKPLKKGTQATIRQASQSGIANRYVDLSMPSGDTASQKPLEDGDTIQITHTTTAVDLDQLFNTLDPPTRVALQDFFKNSAKQFAGKEEEQRLAFHYLNPALSTSSRLFNELNRDQPLLERFLVDSSNLVTDVAEKRDDLTDLVTNLNNTFTALGNQKAALAESIQRLPGFMRQANTTFVDLRAALDDVDPLVDASKPVAKKLGPFLNQLRPLANDARPTVQDLSKTVFQRGKNNDLYDLERSFPALAQIALDRKTRKVNFGAGSVSVGDVRGAFPELVQAAKDSAPVLGAGRPYTPDLMGWFDDFSTTGVYDAGGNISRVFTSFNAFDVTGQLPEIVPLNDQVASLSKTSRTKQFRRCPGGAEVAAPDGSNVYSQAEQDAMECREADRGSGDIP
jgi:phospholipid/cholesterol/gamma-HCH transport system substrate-binding protein